MDGARDLGDGPMPGAIIDAHHHLWELGRFPYDWLAERAPPRPFGNHDAIKRDFLTDDYRAMFAGLPLVASVHVQANCGADNPADETAWLADLSAATGTPQAVVGGIDLASDDAARVLAAHARHPIARGLRALVAHDRAGRWRFADRPDVMDDPVFQRHAARLAEHGFSLDLVVVPEQLEQVARLATAIPGLSIIVDHLATPQAETRAEWFSGVKALGPLPNVALKLSGLWTIDKQWDADRLRPYVSHALHCVGTGRLIYGSNAPIEPLTCPVSRQVKVLAGLLAETGQTGIDEIFCHNAARAYRIGPFPT